MAETGNNVVTRLLERAVNHYISLDPEASQKLATFSGRTLAISITGMEQTFYVTTEEQAIKLSSSCAHEPDTIVTGSPLALIKMALAPDSEPLLLSGEIEISGDTGLARQFKAFLDGMDIDWEGLFSARVGDIAAHQLFTITRKVADWGRYAGEAVINDISEYVQEESRDVVTGAELDIFNREVDRLRDDAERLAARIERLSAAGRPGP